MAGDSDRPGGVRCAIRASGEEKFLEVLEKRVDWSDPRKAGRLFSEGKDRPELAVYSSLRRGWLFGSQEFREKLLSLLEKGGRKIKKANGYHGEQLNDHGARRAARLIEAGLKVFEVSKEELRAQAKETGERVCWRR